MLSVAQQTLKPSFPFFQLSLPLSLFCVSLVFKTTARSLSLYLGASHRIRRIPCAHSRRHTRGLLLLHSHLSSRHLSSHRNASSCEKCSILETKGRRGRGEKELQFQNASDSFFFSFDRSERRDMKAEEEETYRCWWWRETRETRETRVL